MSKQIMRMRAWHYIFDIKEIYKKLHNKEISLQEGAKQISDKINKELLPLVEKEFPNLVSQLKEVPENFQFLASNDEVDVEEFDSVMEDFYNWADLKPIINGARIKLCWINTF